MHIYIDKTMIRLSKKELFYFFSHMLIVSWPNVAVSSEYSNTRVLVPNSKKVLVKTVFSYLFKKYRVFPHFLKKKEFCFGRTATTLPFNSFAQWKNSTDLMIFLKRSYSHMMSYHCNLPFMTMYVWKWLLRSGSFQGWYAVNPRASSTPVSTGFQIRLECYYQTCWFSNPSAL